LLSILCRVFLSVALIVHHLPWRLVASVMSLLLSVVWTSVGYWIVFSTGIVVGALGFPFLAVCPQALQSLCNLS
jgi:hypothetical protein